MDSTVSTTVEQPLMESELKVGEAEQAAEDWGEDYVLECKTDHI